MHPQINHSAAAMQMPRAEIKPPFGQRVDTPILSWGKRLRISFPISFRRRWLCTGNTDARRQRFWQRLFRKIPGKDCLPASSSKPRFAARSSEGPSSGRAQRSPDIFRNAQTRRQVKWQLLGGKHDFARPSFHGFHLRMTQMRAQMPDALHRG